MQLREIHIDGFGIFRDREIRGLSSGINIIYGPNEFGKSTLLAFIRRILFGFPSKSSSENPYPTSTGSAYGGRLKCELLTGETVTIARKPGAHGGPVTINTDSGEFTGDEGLRKLFRGNISSTFYENVYAIGLKELETIKSLENERVKEFIYSASLGLGDVTLTELKSTFVTIADDTFKSQGSKQIIPTIYRDIRELEKKISSIQQELSDYDTLVQQRDSLTHEVAELDRRIEEHQKIVRSLDNKQMLFPTYIDLKKTEDELSRLTDVPSFAADSLTKLEQLKGKIESLQGQSDDETKLLKGLELDSEYLAYNEKILSHEPSIIDLQKKSELYKSAAKDLSSVTSTKNSLKDDIDKEIRKIGTGWTEQTIKNLDLNYLQKDKINSYKQKLSDVKDKVNSSRTKLDYHKEKKASETSKKFQAPAILRYSAYAIVLLGVIGTVTGFMFSNVLVTIVSGVFIVIGIIATVAVTARKQAILPDELEKKYQQDFNASLQDDANLNQEWQGFLDPIRFPAGLSPDGALQLCNTIELIQSKIQSLEHENERIDRMQQTIESVTKLHNKIVTGLDTSLVSGNIEADIEILSKLLSTSITYKQQKESLERQIKQKRAQIDSLIEKKLKAEIELKEHIIAHQSVDEQDFKAKYQTYEKHEHLRETIAKLQTTIQIVTGVGEHYDDFMKSIAETNKEELDSQLDMLRAELKNLNDVRDPKIERIGELKVKIEQLSSSEDLLSEQEKLEIKKQQMNDYSREWAEAQTALFVLDKAVTKYEETRQPAQIEAASDILASITSGTYPRIIKPIDSDEFKIRDKDGFAKSVEQTSRGTMEQLFLALRLGLIKDYEEHQAEPMPIIMDDILVNFDDTRVQLAIKALAEFAKHRQVVVLTCHQNTLDIYKRFGAREIIFS